MKYVLATLALVLVVSGCALRGGPASSNPPKTPSPAVISQINIYQIVSAEVAASYTGDKVSIACNDFVAAVPVSSDIAEADKFLGIWDLLRTYDAAPAQLSNPRKIQTDLTFYSYELQDKTLTVNLTGTLRLDGECDLSRLQETFAATYKQLGVEQVIILVNGTALDKQALPKNS
ncbi:MAG: hypothetical protein WC004_01285 [Candidatus Absconditabacterales bacterium]